MRLDFLVGANSYNKNTMNCVRRVAWLSEKRKGIEMLNHFSCVPRSVFQSILLVALFSVPCFGQNNETLDFLDTGKFDHDGLFSKIDSMLNEASIPGAAIALVSKDAPSITHYYGFADLKAALEVSAKTQFCVGSCTKSFLGVTFLAMIQEGLIDIEAPVSSIVGSIQMENRWSEAHPVRVVHLLEHSAGFDDIRPSSLFNPNVEMPLRDALLRNPDLLAPRWRPGTCYSYSSPGYTLAGHIMEEVTGRKFEDYISESLLRPLGMFDATLRLDNRSQMLLAKGYDNENQALPFIQGYDRPASSLNSSALEMAQFVKFMLNNGRIDGKQLISEEYMARVGRPTSTLASRSGLSSGYSYGVNTFQHNGMEWMGHVGGGPGTLVRYAYCQDLGVGYVVMANRLEPIVMRDIAAEIRDWFSVDSPLSEANSAQVSDEILKEFCGYYELLNSRQQLTRVFDILFGGVTVSFDGETLQQKEFMGSSVALIPMTNREFRTRNELSPSRVFVVDPIGNDVFCSANKYYVRVPAIRVHVFRGAFLACLALIGTVPLYALYWLITIVLRLVRRRPIDVRLQIIKLLPLIALASFVLSTLLLASYPLYLIGTRTLGTVGFYAGSWLFLIISAVGFIALLVWRERFDSRVERVLLTAQCVACLGMATLLWKFGIVGLQAWIY